MTIVESGSRPDAASGESSDLSSAAPALSGETEGRQNGAIGFISGSYEATYSSRRSYPVAVEHLAQREAAPEGQHETQECQLKHKHQHPPFVT